MHPPLPTPANKYSLSKSTLFGKRVSRRSRARERRRKVCYDGHSFFFLSSVPAFYYMLLRTDKGKIFTVNIRFISKSSQENTVHIPYTRFIFRF